MRWFIIFCIALCSCSSYNVRALSSFYSIRGDWGHCEGFTTISDFRISTDLREEGIFYTATCRGRSYQCRDVFIRNEDQLYLYRMGRTTFDDFALKAGDRVAECRER